ncbi:dhhc zinc finger membrane protein [Grosmannia clavigera kw1407]|uniref:Palmitoyltransferase n=1 Tax=Grosmannia clavigera (strain kw1407 / UAMH 11150) TaxID=655863 RepID=F0XBP7_GROCL|nr:dhhc zinc finger membrane protein [Grosmannia clavigera kw1407]EFX05093.1 dhhc zinc finger membrane protein [Grosmannia clavigera kw1407]
MTPAFRTAGPPVHSVNPTMRGVALGIPVFLAGIVGYALYLIAKHVLWDQFWHQDDRHGLAIGLIVPYVVIAALMVASYLRIFITARLDPAVVPLGPESARYYHTKKKAALGRGSGRNHGCSGAKDARDEDRHSSGHVKHGSNSPVDLEAGLGGTVPYGSTGGTGVDSGQRRSPETADPRLDPDSPGLELFYTKEAFECGADGRPLWCNACGTWKPDRAHHSSELNRCVRKLDHFCPWVGGVVSETTFKFFLQFNVYATLLWALTIGIGGYALSQGTDARIIAALALTGVLGLLASAMACTCVHFALTNQTSVETHQRRERAKLMAVHIRRGAPAVEGAYNVVTYPLPKEGEQVGQGLDEVDHPQDPDPFAVARAARAAARRAAARDQLAFRTFAIVAVPRGMNVWDLGWCANWTAVMGASPLDWLLPLRQSPCCTSDRDMLAQHGFYRLSPAFRKLCAQYSLPPSTGMEEWGGEAV